MVEGDSPREIGVMTRFGWTGFQVALSRRQAKHPARSGGEGTMRESEATMKSRAGSDMQQDFSERAGALEPPTGTSEHTQRLVQALATAREEIATLREEIDKLSAPPSTYGVYLSTNKDGTVNVLAQSRKMKVNLGPAIDTMQALRPGQEVILNEGLNVIEVAGYEVQGEVVILKDRLDDERALITLRADEDRVGIISDPLRAHRLKAGDHLLLDPK